MAAQAGLRPNSTIRRPSKDQSRFSLKRRTFSPLLTHVSVTQAKHGQCTSSSMSSEGAESKMEQNQAALRREILRVQGDTSLSAAEKTKRVQVHGCCLLAARRH